MDKVFGSGEKIGKTAEDPFSRNYQPHGFRTPEPHVGCPLVGGANGLDGAYLNTPISLATISPSRAISLNVTTRAPSRSRSASPRRNHRQGRGQYVHPRDEFVEKFARQIHETYVQEHQQAQREGRDFQDLSTNTISLFNEHHLGSKTGWELLHHRMPPVQLIPNGHGNTKYKNTSVILRDVKPWLDFPSYEEILKFSQCDYLNSRFHENKYPERGDGWNEFFGKDHTVTSNENDVVAYLAILFRELRALIRCVAFGRGESWVGIGGGELAMHRREGGNADSKKPDRAAFWTNETGGSLSSRGAQASSLPHETPCLIPGDNKRHIKFSHEKLKQAISRIRGETEMGYVVNQIHDYMDMHHCRYGYVITEKQLIMFQRREGEWGRMEYSPGIPVQSSGETGELTALMVLWYFHVKYAMMDETPGYRLQSTYPLCPSKLGGGNPSSRPKKATDESFSI
jgi:hypothetical protein